ncbi:hypothetical protein GLAREA_01249 [Glarea lozoyensis ATCC 20868]|uniref:Ubiquitin 3 binding protein But2 C-terminal domain-containing protein n=2 Tax=Glarea lozoyensis TaxID=101852 RepID=S3CFS1_GLAL2|nr:uncharacterized protein GLAREA_01249 [Glarea lozoyensis ATCC 20868]EHK97207.1 hypothetical protein M7I_7049 [Glarea lozoyensis 74030]EPE25337.1 hypothetical protein GLAREA_01249 [Glarea lozoyensis ATCC 20868]
MHPTTILLSALTLLTPTTATLFTLLASQPGNPLNGKPINAAGGSFYIGLPLPSTYCPPENKPNCPTGFATVFANTPDTLWVEVPGGQSTYILPTGEIRYAAAHSTFVPPGAYQGGWLNVTVFDLEPQPIKLAGWFPWPAPGQGGITACPTPSEGVYLINAKTPGFTRTDCVDLLGLKPAMQVEGEFGAWSYT